MDPLRQRNARVQAALAAQKHALPICLKVWAENRRASLAVGTAPGSPIRISRDPDVRPPKDPDRLPHATPTSSQAGKE